MGGHKPKSCSSYEKPVPVPSAVWVSPTGFSDPERSWIDELKAYDNNFDTRAIGEVSPSSWSEGLILLITPSISCSKVRFFSNYPGDFFVNQIAISVFYDGAYHCIYEGPFLRDVWNELEIPGVAHNVSSALLTFYNWHESDYEEAWLAEFQFLKVL